jgi:hypothetical protein
MEKWNDLTSEALERRLSEAELTADEERLGRLEEIHDELEDALAAIDVDQAGPSGR